MQVLRSIRVLMHAVYFKSNCFVFYTITEEVIFPHTKLCLYLTGIRQLLTLAVD